MATNPGSSTPRNTRTRAAQTQVEPGRSAPRPPQAQLQAVLHLRGATKEEEEEARTMTGDGNTRRRIQWAEDVVDNEGLGRKSSKVCCIYHAPRGIDESSDESSSDSDDSESGDDGSARPARREGRPHKHSHDHGKGKGKERARSPNAYEKMPKAKSGGVEEKS